jgi:predicted TIM-barrel fold metal-dependent hydrolase
VKLHYFDSTVSIGRTATGQDVTRASLLAELDRIGIERAATYHVVAREHHAATGNAAILEEVAGEPRLVPVWVVHPHHTGELPPPRELVAEALTAGVRMVRMFPSSDLAGHRFSLRAWSAGPLLTELERVRMPVFLDFTLFRRGEPPWDDIVDVCERHPALPIVLVEMQGRNNRNLYAVLEQFPNVLVQSAGFNVHAGIEDVCERFGAHRLVFGSGHPHASLGAARFHIDRARISDHERALIASGNLVSLIDAIEGAQDAG